MKRILAVLAASALLATTGTGVASAQSAATDPTIGNSVLGWISCEVMLFVSYGLSSDGTMPAIACQPATVEGSIGSVLSPFGSLVGDGVVHESA